MINRQAFYDTLAIAPFGGEISPSQMQGLEAILDEWQRALPDGDLRWLAYMLATAYHETAFTMQPVRETLAQSDARAVEILQAAFDAGKLPWVKTRYWLADEDGRHWIGRGLVQLTHRRNYEAMSEATGVDLVAEPDRAMDMDVAIRILFAGMQAGSFTGHRLADFFSPEKEDWVNARRIINGLERAERLGELGRIFHAALTAQE
jgi:predicted chitinase